MVFNLLEKNTDNIVEYCQSNDNFENTSNALISSYSPGQECEIFDIFISNGNGTTYTKIPYTPSGGKRRLKSRK